MNKPVGNLLEPLDRIDAPDLWESITHAAKADVGMGEPADDDSISEYVPQPDDGMDSSKGTTSQRSHRRVTVVLAAAIAAAILLVVGIVVVVDSGGADVVTDPVAPPDEADTAPPPVADPITSPSAIDSLGYEWARVSDDAAVLEDRVAFTAGMTDVVIGGLGMVAVGQGDEGAAVWTSADGIAWSRVPHDEAVFGGGHLVISTITVGGPGFVAVGGDWSDDDAIAGPLVWTSVDGLVWNRVPDDQSGFDRTGNASVNSIIAAGPGLVAVGTDGSAAAVWTSIDGNTWSRVPHDEAIFGGEHDQEMSEVTVGGPGLVAVGSDVWDHDVGQLSDYDDLTGVAAVWTSPDGITWSRVPNDDAVFGGEGHQWMSGVTTGGPGFVAVGGDWSNDLHRAVVWTSRDGIVWSRVPHDDAALGGEHDQLMNSVTSTELGLVAVGRAWAGNDSFNGDSAASVWTSTDGRTWSWLGYDEDVFGSLDNTMVLLTEGPVFTEARQFMSEVVATGTDVVAVGADWSSPAHGSAVWVGTATD